MTHNPITNTTLPNHTIRNIQALAAYISHSLHTVLYQIDLSGHILASYCDIPDLIEELVQYVNTTEDHALIVAAVVHYQLVTIHPFEDGNGRIARALTTMLLARSENTTRCQYALNKQILDQREEYLNQLARAQSGNGDLTEWILWFLKTLKNSIKSRESEIAGLLKKVTFLQRNQQKDLSSRERKIVEAVWNGTLSAVFSVKDVAAFTGTSHDSALRDVQALIQKGVARAENKGGRSQKYSLV